MNSLLRIEHCADPSIDRIIRTWFEIEQSPENFVQYTVSSRSWDPRYPEGLIPLFRDAWPTWDLKDSVINEEQIYSRFSYIGETAIQHITLPSQPLFDQFNASEAVTRAEVKGREAMRDGAELGMRIRRVALESTSGFLGAIMITGKPDEKVMTTDVIYPKIFRQVAALYFKEIASAAYEGLESAHDDGISTGDVPDNITFHLKSIYRALASSDAELIDELCNQLVPGILFDPYSD